MTKTLNIPAAQVAVINSMIGQTVVVNGREHEIVGVANREVRYPVRLLDLVRGGEVNAAFGLLIAR